MSRDFMSEYNCQVLVILRVVADIVRRRRTNQERLMLEHYRAAVLSFGVVIASASRGPRVDTAPLHMRQIDDTFAQSHVNRSLADNIRSSLVIDSS